MADDTAHQQSTPDNDPAAPQTGEISATADLATARTLANIGTSTAGGAEFAPGAIVESAPGQPALLAIDFARAKAFLNACETSSPRVTYGLGKKVPFLNAVPGKDFTQVDCSGFVREAVREATNPTAPFPDGSVVQHDWVQAQKFEKSSVADGAKDDGVMRIAFLSPQDVPSGIGHVVLLLAGKTLESHGGTGPDSRPWTGTSWQAKTSVYNLAHDVQFTAIATSTAVGGVEAAAAPTFTVHHGSRYRATITLSGIEQLATNDMIAGKLTDVGFTDVGVTGTGGTRIGEGTWSGPDTTAQLDPHLTHIVEIPVGAAVS